MKKDDEMSKWLIGGAIFTLTMLGIDWFYSSFELMHPVIRWSLYVVHAIVSLMWMITFAKFKDPDYDFVRQLIVIVTVLVSLGVGVHHATAREDKQVIIDSKENAAKP